MSEHINSPIYPLLTQTLPLVPTQVLNKSLPSEVKIKALLPSCTLELPGAGGGGTGERGERGAVKILRCSSHTLFSPGVIGLRRTQGSEFPRASQERNVVSFVLSGKHKAESNPVSLNSQRG